MGEDYSWRGEGAVVRGITAGRSTIRERPPTGDDARYSDGAGQELLTAKVAKNIPKRLQRGTGHFGSGTSVI